MKQVKWSKRTKREISQNFITLAASLLGNLLTAKGVMRAGKGAIRATQKFNAASSFNKF